MRQAANKEVNSSNGGCNLNPKIKSWSEDVENYLVVQLCENGNLKFEKGSKITCSVMIRIAMSLLSKITDCECKEGVEI